MKTLKQTLKTLILATFAITIFCIGSPLNNNHESVGSIVSVEKSYAADDDENSPSKVYSTAHDAVQPIADESPEDFEARKDAAGASAVEEKFGKSKAIKISDKLLETIQNVTVIIHKMFTPLIHFFTRHIGNLLKNDYIFGGAMGEMLHTIWVISRNIVNVIFVLILLFLAIKHIFTEDENADLKKTLPKFAIMLIAINFSWLATKVVLDAANVATNVVFAIPSGVHTATPMELKSFTETKTCSIDGNNKATGPCVPSGGMWIPFDSVTEKHHKGCNQELKDKINQGMIDAYPKGTDGKDAPPKREMPYWGKSVFCWDTIKMTDFNSSNASYYLTYSMAKIQNLSKLEPGAKQQWDNIAIGTLFSVLLQAVYLIAFASLFIALVIRVAAIWFMVAFSPFLVLFYYLSKDLQMAPDSLEENFSVGAFMKWAFAPAKVGAVWAVGFIMINAGQVSAEKAFAQLDKTGSITTKVFSINSLFLGMDSLQELMWLIMTVGIIWIGTFAVFSKLQVVSSITGKINDKGKEFMSEVGKIPTWAPIIPVINPDTGKLSMGSYSKNYSSLDPANLLRTMRQENSSDNSKENDAHKAFHNTKNTDKLQKLSGKNGAEIATGLKAIDGHFTVEYIKNNLSKVERMINDHKELSPEHKKDMILALKKEYGGKKGDDNIPAGAAAASAPTPKADAAKASTTNINANIKVTEAVSNGDGVKNYITQNYKSSGTSTEPNKRFDAERIFAHMAKPEFSAKDKPLGEGIRQAITELGMEATIKADAQQ